jgi:hypothetical protein
MAGKPWGKFYWADWLSDPKLKLCSLEAQGLWMRMLCIAAEAKPLGYVVLEGNALGPVDLASECGKPLRVVQGAMAELQKWGVFSIDRHGRIYSRRMVQDVKKAKIAQKNGKSGGNPSLSKSGGISPSDNPRLKAQKPETRDQRNRPPKPPGGASPDFVDKAFDEAWSAFPAEGRATSNLVKSKAAWMAALPAAGGVEPLLRAIYAYIALQEAAGPKAKSAPAFHRWLADRRFEAFPGALRGKQDPEWNGPAEIWELVSAPPRGEAFARSWLAAVRWQESPVKALLSASQTTIKKLRDEIGPELDRRGIQLLERVA